LAEHADAAPSDATLLSLFDAMAGSRLLDVAARQLRERGEGYYTISSAGHESNAYIAQALRPTDPALLHYRSGGFFLARALQAGRSIEDALRAVLGRRGCRSGLGRAAQGVRRRVLGHHSADLDHRLTPAASGRRCLRDRAGETAGIADPLGGGLGRGVQLRRREP